jgi:Spy/CpxP family protein refolding chaperone
MNEGLRKAGLWVGAVFVLGVLLGGVCGYMFAHHTTSANMQLTDEQRRAQKLDQMTRELGLSPDQRTQVEGMLNHLHEEYKANQDRYEAQRNQDRQQTREHIRALLTPEQQPKFEEFLRRMDEERKRNPPPPPGR